jgi:hypothetical protein
MHSPQIKMQDLRRTRDGVERGNLNNDENYDLMISNMISISFELIRTDAKFGHFRYFYRSDLSCRSKTLTHPYSFHPLVFTAFGLARRLPFCVLHSERQPIRSVDTRRALSFSTQKSRLLAREYGLPIRNGKPLAGFRF